MNKVWKKWLVLAVVAVVAAFLLEIVQINTQPKNFTPSPTDEILQKQELVYPELIYGNYNYEIEEDELVTVGPDPQLYFSTGGLGIVSNVYFYFSRPTETALRIQVFYPGEDGYSERNSMISTCPAGVEFWSVGIPAGEDYDLRVDIDGAPNPLKSIGVGNIPPAKNSTPGQMHPFRIAVMTVLLFAVLFWMGWCKAWIGMKNALIGACRNIREGKIKSALWAGIFIGIICVSVFLFWIFISVIGGKPYTVPRMVFAGFVGLFAACMLVFRKTLKAQPEYIFLVLVLCVGFLYCYYVPHTGLNSWDEDYHYTQALKTSYVDSILLTQQDELTINRSVPASFDLNGGIRELNDKQDLLYQSGATEKRTIVTIKGLPELFNGIGLFIGRALGMRYYMIHFMGRFTGLIAYAFLGFFAIRKLKSGKMIAAVTLLIPTGMFLASSYNYDSYLTGFTAVGLCYYISYWQDRNAKVSLKDALIMIGTISFGCLTKQIYIPILWILVLLPASRFIDRKHHVYFVLSLAAATALVMFTYVLPSLVHGGGDGDIRGGSDVSTSGQLRYILGHPLAYLDVMWRYMTNEYFEMNRLGEFMTNMAYHGIMPNQYIYLGLLVAVAFTDKNEYDRELVHHPWAHIWPILVALAGVILVMTSMYLAFTPVGGNRVNGAQFRYLIPLVLPVLLHIGSGKVENNMDRGWYNGIVFSVAAFVEFACVYNAFITRYA